MNLNDAATAKSLHKIVVYYDNWETFAAVVEELFFVWAWLRFSKENNVEAAAVSLLLIDAYCPAAATTGGIVKSWVPICPSIKLVACCIDKSTYYCSVDVVVG